MQNSSEGFTNKTYDGINSNSDAPWTIEKTTKITKKEIDKDDVQKSKLKKFLENETAIENDVIFINYFQLLVNFLYLFANH